MKCPLTMIISILLLLLLSCPIMAKGWQLDLKLDQYENYLDSSQRLTKTLGDFKLLMQARQLDLGKDRSNSLNFRLATKLFGVEYITNDEVPKSMLSFVIDIPRQKKPTIVNTSANSVLHAFAKKEFNSGYAKFDFFSKDGKEQVSLTARAEF